MKVNRANYIEAITNRDVVIIVNNKLCYSELWAVMNNAEPGSSPSGRLL